MSMIIKRILLRLAIMLVLAIVFLAYFQPEFMFDMANRIALCF
jgi:type II secretory pathway component PulM